MKIKIFIVTFLMSFSSLLLADSGKDVYDRYCVSCHSPSMASLFNSPAAHDTNAWDERKTNAFERAAEKNNNIKNLTGIEKENKSINELLVSAINGTDKGMPPKGTCSDCTDEDLKSAIKFMSSSE